MAQRLTTFSKFLLTLIIVGAIAFLGKCLLENTEIGKDLVEQGDSGNADSSGSSTASSDNNSSGSKTGGLFNRNKNDDDVIKIGVVTWGGYAGGQYFNEGFKANEESRFYKDYGIKVEFVLNDDVDASLNAWKKGDIDLHWYTIDAFPTIAGGLKDYDPVVLWQADWSRGGDAIVVRPGIRNVADLKGKKVAVAEMTPSHSFLLYLLEAGGMRPSDIDIVTQASAIDAAAAFKSKNVDAAVVWSPDDEACLRAVNGSRVLESSRNASHIIADFFFAKRDFVNKNDEKLQKLYEGWMKGAAEINSSNANKQKAGKILAEGLGIPQADAIGAIDNVRLTTHGDNQNFFGLNTSYKSVTGESLYRTMSGKYKELGYADDAPSWNRIKAAQFVQRTKLSGPSHSSEGKNDFATVTKADEKKEAIATKQVSINFRTGEYKLDENSKYIIDKDFVDIAKSFGNSRIRIEGNTDNTGSRATNISLSKKRAQSVADYLVEAYDMPRNRFIIKGNGPDNPVADNNTDNGRAKNRRTDFELVAN